MTTTVYSSTEVDALIAAIPSGAGGGRTRLTAWANFYADASAGNDTNTGLSWASAWKTAQRAIDYVSKNVDFCDLGVLVNCKGTFTDPVTIAGPFVGDRGGSFNLIGSTADKTVATFTAAINVINGAHVSLQWLTVGGTPAVPSGGLIISTRAQVDVFNVRFGACPNRCVEAASGFFVQDDVIEIAADSPYFMVLESGANGSLTGNITAIGGTRNFSNAFLNVNAYSTCETSGMTKTGSFTGTQAQLLGGYLNADTLTALPGNAPVVGYHDPASLYYVGGVRQ